MKTKKIFLASMGLILVLLFISTSSVNADTQISQVDYPEEVEPGEVITVTVFFNYPTVYDKLLGPEVWLFYSINSFNIAEDDFYVTAEIAGLSRVESVTFDIPTSTLEIGDNLRFEIRYDWYIFTAYGEPPILGSVVSNMYRINIVESTEQTTTDETTTTDKTGGINRTNIPMSGLIAISTILAFVVVAAIIFNVTVRKRR